MKDSSKTSMTPVENGIVGVTAAFVEAIILQPTLYWKNAQFQRLPFTLDPRIVYRGTGASIFNEMQMMGLQFGVTAACRQILFPSKTQENTELTANQELVTAGVGGSICAIASCPIELIMIQQQLHGGTLIGTPINIAKKYGLFNKGMYRGLSATMIRDFIYVSGLLGVTPVVQGYLKKEYGMSNMKSGLYASLVGGVFAALPSHPLDIIKTCMQGDLEQNRYSSYRITTKLLFNEGGLKRFTNGLFWRSFNIVATVYIANELINGLPPLMFARHRDKN